MLLVCIIGKYSTHTYVRGLKQGRSFQHERRPKIKSCAKCSWLELLIKKFPDTHTHTHTHTQPPRAPGTSKSRLLYLSDTSTPGAAERRKEGWSGGVEMEMVGGGQRKRETVGMKGRQKWSWRWKEGVSRVLNGGYVGGGGRRQVEMKRQEKRKGFKN